MNSSKSNRMIAKIKPKDQEALLKMLRKIKFNQVTRNAVLRNEKDHIIYDAQFGVSVRRGVSLTKDTCQNVDVFKFLVNFLLKFSPDARCSTINVNYMRDYETNGDAMITHVDSKNVGKGYLLSVGDFTGGELNTFFGSVDTHNKLYECDMTLAHKPGIFTGERYSIVFYTQYTQKVIMKPGHRKRLSAIENKHGFKLPWQRKERCNLFDKLPSYIKTQLDCNRNSSKREIEEQMVYIGKQMWETKNIGRTNEDDYQNGDKSNEDAKGQNEEEVEDEDESDIGEEDEEDSEDSDAVKAARIALHKAQEEAKQKKSEKKRKKKEGSPSKKKKKRKDSCKTMNRLYRQTIVS